jgi:hypothetical protein
VILSRQRGFDQVGRKPVQLQGPGGTASVWPDFAQQAAVPILDQHRRARGQLGKRDAPEGGPGQQDQDQHATTDPEESTEKAPEGSLQEPAEGLPQKPGEGSPQKPPEGLPQKPAKGLPQESAEAPEWPVRVSEW